MGPTTRWPESDVKLARMDHPTHVLKNREAWTGHSVSYEAPGRRAWESSEITWGIWNLPESSVGALGDLSRFQGKELVELGCGTAYFSAWFARLGARPIGVDITPAQLENARRFQREFGIEFPLIEANAEDTGLPLDSFDFAFSEYGASIWCDPYRWIPEAARLLRSGGELIFMRNSTLSMLCTGDAGPVTTSLQRDYRSLGQMEWEDDKSVEFHIPPGEMIRLLRKNGLEVEDLIELTAPTGATTTYEYMDAAWGKKWPSEEIWIARKR